jgi:hypothetical protein
MSIASTTQQTQPNSNVILIRINVKINKTLTEKVIIHPFAELNGNTVIYSAPIGLDKGAPAGMTFPVVIAFWPKDQVPIAAKVGDAYTADLGENLGISGTGTLTTLKGYNDITLNLN